MRVSDGGGDGQRVLGAKQAKRRSEGVLLSLAFVLGIAAMFVPMGVLAGMTGSFFSAVLQTLAKSVQFSCVAKSLC